MLLTTALVSLLAQGAVADPKAQSLEDAKNLAHILRHDQNCKWLRDDAEAAVNASLADIRARAATDPAHAANIAKATAGPFPAPACGGPEQARLSQLATNARSIWLIRTEALYQAAENSPFGKGMTYLGSNRAPREAETRKLAQQFVAQRGQAGWQAAYGPIMQEAATTIALACDNRKNAGTKDVRQCPPIPANFKQFIPTGIAQLEAAETFAKAYEKQRQSEIAYQAYQKERAAGAAFSGKWKLVAMSDMSAIYGSTTCRLGDYIFDFEKAQNLGNGSFRATVMEAGMPGRENIATVDLLPSAGIDHVVLGKDARGKAIYDIDNAAKTAKCP